MAKKQFRGVEKHQELSAHNEWRDIRGFGEKARAAFEKGDALLYVGGMALGLMWVFPSLMEPMALIALGVLLWASKIQFSLPFRMPATSKLLDPNSLSPKTGQPEMAKGVAFLGNDIQTDKELWFTNDDMRTHILAFGSTGSGKTEALISMAFNTLIQGSGFIYVDGKGDTGLWAKIYSIARSLGREDDLLVINYMTGGRDVFGPQKTKLSNTMNPFITGSASGLTEMLVSLMDESGGDNAMWQGRAISLVSAIMFALVYLRENQGLLLDVDVIREHLILDNIQKLAKRRDLPNNILQSVRAYLRSLPGYKENPPGGQQGDTALDQHGYLQMQFTKILGSLSDTYGYIFRTNLGEVDFSDVVLNRRILVVLLPAMEKAPAELGNLGKIIIAGIKQMMATGLGDRLEGSHAEVIEVKPSNAKAPFMCILDEYGYYVVKGASVMPAQARSLGFCMVFAGQDYPAFKKNNMAEEAISTIGNCNIKIFMKTEDPTETTELFEKSVGQALVSQTGGFSQSHGLLRSGYTDTNNANLARRSRGDVLDLKDQSPGEAHIIFKSTLVRAKMFYAEPEMAAHLKVNSFLRVEPPTREEMTEFDKHIADLGNKLSDPELAADYIDDTGLPAKLELFRKSFAEGIARGDSTEVAGLDAIAATGRQAYAALDGFGRGARNGPGAAEEGRLSVFSDRDSLDEFDLEDEEGEDSEHEEDEDGEDGEDGLLLHPERTRQRLTDLQVAAGANPQQAREQAERMRADMQALSSYPQHVPDPADPGDIVSIIQELGDEIAGGRGAA